MTPALQQAMAYMNETRELTQDEVGRIIEEAMKAPQCTSIYCCTCNADVEARLTDGAEIYQHRPDLHTMPFWKCDACGNYVGCHHKTKDRTRPLGCIPSPRIKELRKRIHAVLDPIWQGGTMSRGKLYAMVSERIGKTYHTGEIRREYDAHVVYHVALAIRESIKKEATP